MQRALGVRSLRCLSTKPRLYPTGSKEISCVGFGGQVAPGTHPKTMAEILADYLKSGGSIVQVMPGWEHTINESLYYVFADESRKREDVMIMGSFPVRRPPFLQEGEITTTPSGTPLSGNYGKGDQPYPILRVLSHCGVPPLNNEEQLRKDIRKYTKSLIDNMPIEQVDVVLVDIDHLIISNTTTIATEGECSSVDGGEVPITPALTTLFSELELIIKEGILKSYGVTSTRFGLPKSSPSHLSLESIIRLSNSLGGGLSVVSSPVSVLDSGVIVEKNCEEGKFTTLEIAHKNGLLVAATNPLDTTDKDGEPFILRSYERQNDGEKLAKMYQKQMETCVQFETAYPLMVEQAKPSESDLVSKNDVSWAAIVGHNHDQTYNVSRWDSILKERIKPCLFYAIKKLSFQERFGAWAIEYSKQIDEFFDLHTKSVHHTASFESERIEQALHKALPSLAHTPKLETKALQIVLSSGVDIVLTDDQCLVRSTLEAVELAGGAGGGLGLVADDATGATLVGLDESREVMRACYGLNSQAENK